VLTQSMAGSIGSGCRNCTNGSGAPVYGATNSEHGGLAVVVAAVQRSSSADLTSSSLGHEIAPSTMSSADSIVRGTSQLGQQWGAAGGAVGEAQQSKQQWKLQTTFMLGAGVAGVRHLRRPSELLRVSS
jgi:hypothetical protein